MQAKKKQLETKAKTKVTEKRKRVVAATSLFFIITLAYFFYTQSTNHNTSPTTFQFKAAIIDQLSLKTHNQTFIETATTILKQAGYTVDYFPNENITVKFYKDLPTHGYGIIIFRVHTTERGAFFTSEPYSTSSYIWEQINDQIWKVSYDGNPPYYFGISPSFVKSCMNGKFSQAIIIAMGCYSLKFNDMAQAFIEKGAKAYIGWTGSVLSSHTDKATIRLVQRLVTEKQTIIKATMQTMEEVGPDPAYEHKSTLLVLPQEAWEDTLPTK